MSDRLAAALSELVAALREEIAAEARPDPAAPERLLSVAQTAEITGLGRTRLYAELDAGRLRSLKVGRRRLVPAGAIGEYVAAQSSDRGSGPTAAASHRLDPRPRSGSPASRPEAA